MNNDISEVSSRVSTLEGNFNMALTNLYNACVDKGSTPSAQTISAIVTAVQNISVGGDSIISSDDYPLENMDDMLLQSQDGYTYDQETGELLSITITNDYPLIGNSSVGYVLAVPSTKYDGTQIILS